MNATSDKSTRVVVATDGSDPSKAAVDWAAFEAVSRREPLLIITACPPVQVPPSSVQESAIDTVVASVLDMARLQMKEHQEIVLQASDRVRKQHPELVVTTEVFEGEPRLALELYEHLASVVVLGSRGLGSVRAVLLGSVSFWATRHATVPLVVVRPFDLERLAASAGIAVGIASDGSSETTLREGFAMAARRHVPLTIANASWDSEAPGTGWRQMADEEVEPRRRHAVAALAERIAGEYPEVSYKVVFGRGAVDRLLADLGRTHSALLVGRRASTALDFVGLGSVASAVVEHAAGATMIVPVEGVRP